MNELQEKLSHILSELNEVLPEIELKKNEQLVLNFLDELNRISVIY